MNENDIPPSASDGVPEAEAPPSGPTFAELGLGEPLVRALTEMGFSRPMKVQATTIPLVKAGKDLMVQSRTGSGKTAAFGIPIIDGVVRAEDKFVQAIILLPTRELALQVASELTRISAHSGITVVPVYGGAPMGRQIEQLKAGGQIVCGTPGRVMDHMRRGTLSLDKVRCAVLDECDEMLSMGFQEDIEKILERTPTERQTLLFSATVPEGIQRLSRRFLRNPENVKLSADFVGVQEIRHVYYTIPGGQRENELLRVLAFENPGRAIVFCNTREETGRVAEFLRRQGFESEAISSDLAQNDRERVMTRMREGGIRFLVATDVAARGIDLESLSHVINYTFPESPEVYIHRTGRTGRAGRHGTAISLIGPPEVGAFYYVKLLYKIKPEERSLPSEAEIRSKREGERVATLRARYGSDPGPAARSLARRLMTAVDGERLLASMLAEILSIADKEAAASGPPVEAIVPRESIVQTPKSRDGGRDGDRGGRGGERGRFGSRDRGREGERSDRPERSLRGDRPERGPRLDRERRPERERSERPDPTNRPEPTERPERLERPERTERSERPARADRPERTERPESVARPERPERAERPVRRETAELVPVSPEPTTTANDADTSRNGESETTTGERPAFAGRERSRRRDRSGREPRLESVTAVRGPEPRDSGAAKPASAEGAARAPGNDNEFWSVWSEDPVEGEARPRATGTTARPPENAEWRRAPAPTEGSATEARLFLNLGRKDDASSDEVLALFAELGVTVSPADIDVMNTHSYVNVPASEADRLCERLSGRDRNGRPLLCERARPRRR
ncbi:MAG TPA: DEAD/DEAH box helicase [Polyangia bacterium]